MTGVENDILIRFLSRLEQEPDVTPSMLDALRELLSSGNKASAEDLVQIFARPSEEQIP